MSGAPLLDLSQTPASGATPSAPTRHRGLGLAVGLAASAAFATSGPFVKPLLEAGWSPGGAIIVRLTIGAVLLAVPTLIALRRLPDGWRTVAANWRWIVAFGVMGVAAPSTLYFLAVERLPVAVALLVEYTGPLLLIGWSWLRTRRMPSPGVLVGASLAMFGLVAVLDLTGAIALDPVGLMFAAGSAIGNASYFALTARPSPVPPVAMAGLGMIVGAVVVTVVGATGILAVRMPFVDVTLLEGTVPAWVPLLVVGAVPTAVAYGVSVISVRMLGERVASFVGLSEVLFAVLLAWFLIGERPTTAQSLGAVAVVAGVAIVRRWADRSPIDLTGPADLPSTALPR
ncbi:EamA family transporter [Serinibacter arcticus]|uniref:EamA family transporter n=1 Tax=Serinibacter arcticus TaxID=1655435 RepID=A0A2U1ZSX7_9MICO|nr:EamA family transporter [Serinibacter arcticus]PWD50089.1 EamA family transporter [Serinibacter arcticus]